MKRVNQNDLRNMYEPVPQALEDEISRIMTSLEHGEERTIVKRKISVSFILAAVLIIASVAALAAGNMNLFSLLTNRADPILPLEGADKLVKTGLGSVENEYVTMTVEAAAYDGRSVTTLMRITPKDSEKYALMNAFMQSAPEEIYETEICAVEVEKGTQSVELDGILYEIVNEENEKAFRINGESVEIPGSPEEAAELDMPFYIENGTMYEADVFEFRVTGRKDGREIIDWQLGTTIGNMASDAEGGSLGESRSMDAEEQPDGSVLVWSENIAYEDLAEMVTVRVGCSVTVNGHEMTLEDVVFDIKKSEPARGITLVPEGGRIGESIEILSAEISFTRLRGYLTVEYIHMTGEGEYNNIVLFLCDADGNRITDGSSQTWEAGENRYCQEMEIQSLEEIPDTLIIEAREIEGGVLGKCVCTVVKD